MSEWAGLAAEIRRYRDAKSHAAVRVNHARLTDLTPDTEYVYTAVRDGANRSWGRYDGRKPLRFTSFGDNQAGRRVSAHSIRRSGASRRYV
ncbi:hypothetical protein AWC15_15695 [Mycobacterium lacus]|uniref:Uncharacterized protein n=1 Tax=Mycobacterium lacus TaxID=169765 RepID=A0A1X1YMA7_9MYCO|nr:hypothetical protein AWC15_15695 [Mycobacterium lacus]BBX95877.1 hypothetical protein MLAC_11710 [Mycobacterium lacus]